MRHGGSGFRSFRAFNKWGLGHRNWAVGIAGAWLVAWGDGVLGIWGLPLQIPTLNPKP